MSPVPSWTKLGRSAEVEVAILLILLGWNVRLSPGSRGPADLYAQRKTDKWLIQVKSSEKVGRLKGSELKQLKDLAARTSAVPVIALVQPWMTVTGEAENIIRTDHFAHENLEDARHGSEATKLPISSLGIFFQSLVDWKNKQPF